jgi:hypothetical protein
MPRAKTGFRSARTGSLTDCETEVTGYDGTAVFAERSKDRGVDRFL